MSTSQRFPLAWPAGWPRTKNRRQSRYQVKGRKAYDDLIAELRRFGATAIVTSSNAALRNDGLPYTEALDERHADPGAAIYFRHGNKDRVIACDTWILLRENIRAIGYAIEGLRAIERSGATELLERAFTGFTQIEDRSRRPWHEVLGCSPTATGEEIDAAYRAAAKGAHPDLGGSDAKMAEVNRAREMARAPK